MKSRARALQRLTGSYYQTCLQQLRTRRPIIMALRSMHPEMTQQEAEAAICFEDEDDLKQRWGQELFDLAFPQDLG